MVEVLDYSAGWPDPAAIRSAGYLGVVRYIGTPGRRKNLTRAEADALRSEGVAIGLVYEDSAGWMQGGARAGVVAARAVEADAATCGVELRSCMLACDQQVLATQQMDNVMACLDGASTAWGLGVTGIYGQKSVVDTALGARHATWGWQTAAWSGGVVSALAHLYQHAGYVTVGGIQCDRSTVLRSDWGQVPRPGSPPADQEVPVTDEDIQKIVAAITPAVTSALIPALVASMAFRLMVRGELITALSDPGHQYLQDDLAKANKPLADQLATVTTTEGSLLGKVDAMAGTIAAMSTAGVDLDELATKVVDQLARRLES